MIGATEMPVSIFPYDTWAALPHGPSVLDEMFRARAAQFRDRLGWDVCVAQNGWEVDQYDPRPCQYAILTDGQHHLASMRLMPTTAPHMADDVFKSDLRLKGVWEVSRFCLSQTAPQDAARRLFLGVGQAAFQMGLEGLVGIFDRRMVKVYGRFGFAPDEIPLGSHNVPGDIRFGYWKCSRFASASFGVAA
ncbi:MAG: acyl-homoserine-lactone synthase [Pseudomonadota bacterium]